MSSTTVLLARHGETDLNRDHVIQGGGVDAEINALGRQQAALLGAELARRFDITAMYSSTLRRAKQTASIVGDKLGLQPGVEKDLEEMNFGDWEGLRREDVIDGIREIYGRWSEGESDLRLPNGESPDDVVARSRPKVEEIADRHSGSTVLLILHGRMMRILISNLLSRSASVLNKGIIKNTAWYELKWDGKGFELVHENMAGHLESLSEPTA